jgi:hypothetical protein
LEKVQCRRRVRDRADVEQDAGAAGVVVGLGRTVERCEISVAPRSPSEVQRLVSWMLDGRDQGGRWQRSHLNPLLLASALQMRPREVAGHVVDDDMLGGGEFCPLGQPACPSESAVCQDNSPEIRLL